MTESGSASDLTANINTTAVESGDNFIINGEKHFITGANACDYMLVLAKTDPESENKQTRHSILIVDVANTPGIEARPIKKLLVRSMSSNVVSFNNVCVPKSNLIGERGQGFYHLLPLLGGHRLMAVGEAVGLAQSAYDEAMAYAKERKSFGHPIGHYQLTQQKLVDMETEIRAARLLGYHAAWLTDMGKSNMMETLIAQRYSSEIAFKTATHAMEIFGGYGFAEEYNMVKGLENKSIGAFATFCGPPLKTFEIDLIFIPMERIARAAGAELTARVSVSSGYHPLPAMIYLFRVVSYLRFFRSLKKLSVF